MLDSRAPGVPSPLCSIIALVPPKVPWRAGNEGIKPPEVITCSMSRRLVPSRMEGTRRCHPEFGALSPCKTLPGPGHSIWKSRGQDGGLLALCPSLHHPHPPQL